MNTVNLEKISEQYKMSIENCTRRIIICAGTGCLANGSMNVYEELKNKAELKGLDIKIELDKHDDTNKSFIHLTGSGCQGFCAEGPLLTILPENILYTKVRVTDVEEIVNETLLNNRIITRLLYENPVTHERNKGTDEIPFYKLQKRLVLGECGL
ncbi:MAG: (2Fe-2S) ferredoxin domain-containing protein, partial [Bacteroidota bacterium]|nr:(2Fe-2S) ferredoxin domain-containing protein [Bacteroidota bacterium]